MPTPHDHATLRILTFFYANGDHRVELSGITILANPRAPEKVGRIAEAHAQKTCSACTRAAKLAGVKATS